MSSILIILRVLTSPYNGEKLPFNQSNNELKSLASISIIITCSIGSVASLNGTYVTLTLLNSVTTIAYGSCGYNNLIYPGSGASSGLLQIFGMASASRDFRNEMRKEVRNCRKKASVMRN